MKIAEPGQPQLDNPKGEDNFLVRGWFWLGILAVLLVFGPSLWHYFTGEDFVFIAAAQGKAFYEPTQRLFYRPLPNIFWQADYALWGLWAGGYHLTNLLLHLVNIVLVGLLARKLSGQREVGGLAAIFFALHPAHIEAVTWLASRPDLITTAFCLLSALTGLKFFDNFTSSKNLLWLYLLSLLTFAAGLFSKEAAASWPLALFGIILIRQQGRDWKKLILWFLPYLVVGLVYGLVRYNALGGLGGYSSNGRDWLYISWNLTGGLWLPLLFPLNLEAVGTGWAIILISGLLLIYLGLLWPFIKTFGAGPFHRLTTRRKLPGTPLPARHTPSGAGGVIMFLTIAQSQLFAKSSYLIALVLIYASLLPVLNTAPVDTNLAQSRILYLPSVGFCLLVALLLEMRLKPFAPRQGQKKKGATSLTPINLASAVRSNIRAFAGLGLSGLLVIWQLLAVQINLSSWQKASELVRQTFSQLTPYQIPFAEGDTLYFEGLPDNYQGAYGWRNGLEPAATLLTGRKLGGFFRTPELRVDYRKNESGRLWFLRYQYDERQANLKLAAIYNAGPEQAIAQTNPNLLASWDFTTCDGPGSPGWDWKPGAGQIVCLKGKGLQFDTIGQKTGLSARSPAFEVARAKRFYLDLTTYTDFDFEQPQVLAEIRLSDAENGQDLGGFPFDLAADGRSHTYRLYLEPTRPTRALTITLRANKTRSNILWQRISGLKS